MKSKKFQDLLLTDPTTQEGRDLIAEHFDITDKWNKNHKSGTKKGLISDSASTYYYLLMTVKCESKNDFIWMSFYEGLHRHTALLLSLTSSAFNLTKNEIKFKSLTTEYFQQQRLENFKRDSKQPHERLNDIFDGKVKAKMLSEIFNIKAIIPRKLEEPLKTNAVANFTNKITNYSELISNSKQTSAENSVLSLLSKTLQHDQEMSTSEERNTKTNRPNLFHSYKVQTQLKKIVHETNMRKNNDDFVVYSYCGLLHTTKWDDYIKNPLNDQATHGFLDKMTHRSKYMISELSETDKEKKINKYPPYAN